MLREDKQLIKTVTTHSTAETERWAEVYAQNLTQSATIALIGDLGVGKTVIARGIGRGLGVREAIISPTFNYVLEYTGRLPLYHADLYRIESPDTFRAMGLDEYFERGGIFLIEWAERILDLLPETATIISITEGETENDRIMTIRRSK
jgi:tRNA threonylcarbamoyladenosine biosynthesis protein TsaE